MNRILAAAGAALLTVSAGAAAAQSFQLPYPFGGQPRQQQPYGNQPYGQPYGGQTYGSQGYGPSITFYEGENFSGRQITVYGEERDFARLGFNDRARSAQTNGSFLACQDSEFRGRCERLSGSIPNLDRFNISRSISSVREDQGGYGYNEDDRYEDYGRPGAGGGYGNPRRDGVQGRTVIFFARPNVSGNDIAARGQSSADQFCRASGYGSAVYYAQGERSRSAVDQDGRQVDAPALRDVLCRTR